MPAPRVTGRALVDTLTEPRRVVVVGGSSDPAKLSGRSLRYLLDLGYQGEIIAVTRRDVDDPRVRSVRAIAGIRAVPGTAAIVNLPAAAVTPALDELDRAGVDATVVIGSGFEDPATEEHHALRALLARDGFRMRILGPNCVGSMSSASGAHLNFSSVLQSGPPRPGGIALVTQSGALGNGLLMTLLARSVGVGHWFSTGDEFDIGAIELMGSVLERPDVSCVGLFLEGITDPRWLAAAGSAIASTGKPVFVLKAARTGAGAVAAGGHTGRVVGASDITSAALRELGAVEVTDVAALADALTVADVCRPRAGRGRVGIVSVSGASGVIAADRVSEAPGLRMAVPEPGVSAADPRLHPANPVDVPFIGETAPFAAAVTAVRTGGTADVVVAVESSLAHDHAELASALSAPEPDAAPVVLTHLSEVDALTGAQLEELAKGRVAVLPTVERAVAAVAANVRSTDVAAPAPASDDEPSGTLLGLEAGPALLPGVHFAPWHLAPTVDDARAAAIELGYPCVVKAAGRTIAHRADVGAVEMVRDAGDLAAAHARVATACAVRGDVPLVQAFAPPGGLELLVAAVNHPEVGPAAVVQAGGTLAELMTTRAIVPALCPPARRRELLAESPAGRLLAGYRGAPPRDAEAVAQLVDALLDAVARDGLAFVELNPVLVHETGLSLVDLVARRSDT